MKITPKYFQWFFCLAIFFVFPELNAQYAVIDVSGFSDESITSRAFIVHETLPVYIDAVGAMRKVKNWKNWNPMIAYAWMIEAPSGELVWAMNENNVTRLPASFNVSHHSSLSLKPGKYEVYYSTLSQRIIRLSRTSGQWREIIRSFERLFTDEDFFGFDDQHAEWRLRMLIRAEDRNKIEIVPRHEPDTLAFIRLTGARDRDYLEKGFTLSKAMPVFVYCLGEGMDNKMYDYGWIINDRTAERVWDMKYSDTRHAGGADKNRLFADWISLPAGNYIAVYMTDDSHSSEEWNMQPPYDPNRWGLEIRASSINALTNIRDYRREKKKEIITITPIRSGEYRSERFTVSRKINVLIYAIGEGKKGRMYDYGWITDEKTGARIWEMTFDKTRYAGGAEKNRMIEEILTLQPGLYQVYYVTDNSHAFGDWNDQPPYHENRWGLTMSLIQNDEEPFIRRIAESEDHSVLIKIHRVRDNEYISKSFILSDKTSLRIQCLGEGKKGKMFDYGWIRNTKTGQVVWEMTFSASAHAGGSKKNRLFDGLITLEAGEYEVIYISDDSHHYNEWNDDPPYQPDLWGITIRKVE